MGHVFTIIAPGAMGSAVARRMHQRGATMRTSLAGRSAASARRAAAAVEDRAPGNAITTLDGILGGRVK